MPAIFAIAVLPTPDASTKTGLCLVRGEDFDGALQFVGAADQRVEQASRRDGQVDGRLTTDCGGPEPSSPVLAASGCWVGRRTRFSKCRAR